MCSKCSGAESGMVPMDRNAKYAGETVSTERLVLDELKDTLDYMNMDTISIKSRLQNLVERHFGYREDVVEKMKLDKEPNGTVENMKHYLEHIKMNISEIYASISKLEKL